MTVPNDSTLMNGTVYSRKFYNFLKTYKVSGQDDYEYRHKIQENLRKSLWCVTIQIAHLQYFDSQMADAFMNNPSQMLHKFEIGAQRFVRELLNEKPPQDDPTQQIPEQAISKFQIMFSSRAQRPLQVRELTATHVAKFVSLTGIVIVASRTRSKATMARVQCTRCSSKKTVFLPPGFATIPLPQSCGAQVIGQDGAQTICSGGQYVIVPHECQFMDQQTLKLQERPEDVPTGEMPRSLTLTCDRYLVEQAPPGTRINVVGIYSTFRAKTAKAGQNLKGSGVAYPYLRVLGIQQDHSGIRAFSDFDPDEEALLREFPRKCRQQGTTAYKRLSQNIDPAIWGHDDIKMALCCQLFGGSTKRLPDGIRRRGDINVLLLGDPSTAKSQLLKFVQKVAPIGVYTSGKGSSAAGLTASVRKEPGSGEFYLEGGSMVLADGGIVCIDEFDKMRVQDRVAIHEAMEQQTISIAKAGITTVLNARTSVLAAANPIFGNYEDSKTPDEQIDFQSTILSRFDMIFIVRDIKERQRDMSMSEHIINLHTQSNTRRKVVGDLDLGFVKKYIGYCRTHCSPRLNSEAALALTNFYVSERDKSKHQSNTIPMTVRQLEALVRITESLAKMDLLKEATKEHADEAIRLFSTSTIQAKNAGLSASSERIAQIEEKLRSRFTIGQSSSRDVVISAMRQQGYKRRDIETAIGVMTTRGEVKISKQG
eukprot:CAMPEP_0117437884 /NCGR_PEP_ID=MMETSP0759-20121206/1762_1 /TAXON_ID=63605 /ORGANISM="Percolomonas cosmopolitus, Strain WS" /LENGTH=707 /DNA_ID=CAMNT_0005229547 /DNA_START=17 /DNA_END=2136 /DNA_ORIENTATION=+